MRDARTSRGIWVRDAQIYVPGDSKVGTDRSSWPTIAVLEVHPRGVAFRIGWRTEAFAAAEFYSDPVITWKARFGMSVGDQGVDFVVRPVDGRTPLTIELVELTTEGDARYVELPRY